MPPLIYRRAATVTAGTPINNPLTIDLSFPVAVVDWVEVRLPPGSNGHFGWYLAMGGQEVLPVNDGTLHWVIAVDETLHWDLADQPDSGAWELVGYNTGQYDHTAYVTFAVHPPVIDTGAAGYFPVGDLSTGGATSSTA